MSPNKTLERPRDLPKFILLGAAIMAASLGWTVLLPGYTASQGNVFYVQGLRDRLPEGATKVLNAYEAEQAFRQEQLSSISKVLSTRPLPSPEQIDSMLKLRAELIAESSRAIPPIYLAPFHLNPQLLLWPTIYTCLGWLIVLFRPPIPLSLFNRSNLLHMICLGTVIYVIYEWPLWVRNFVLSNEGRTLYAYPNFDIHPASFFMQEGVVFGFCLLLAVLWMQWNEFFKSSFETSRRLAVNGNAQEWREQLSSLFIQWQICSVVLALGFLFFTQFFWTLVASYHDQRYLLSAINAHLLWLVSWLTISLPLFMAWKYWNDRKVSSLFKKAEQSVQASELSAELKVVQNLEPLSGVALSMSALSAIAAFVWPIVQAWVTAGGKAT